MPRDLAAVLSVLAAILAFIEPIHASDSTENVLRAVEEVAADVLSSPAASQALSSPGRSNGTLDTPWVALSDPVVSRSSLGAKDLTTGSTPQQLSLLSNRYVRMYVCTYVGDDR